MTTLATPLDEAMSGDDAHVRRTDRGYDATSDRSVCVWLIAGAMAVVAAIAIGGITRLTESGLSITGWRPIAGILPPRDATAWNDAYTRYLAIPEAQTVHQGITLAAFKQLFWWEWVHRLLARGVGLVLTLPYFVLLLQGKIRPSLRVRLANLPLLAALQGAMGWYMVRSGLAGRNSVSPYRLVAHLSLALVVFVLAVWTAASLSRDVERRLTGRVQRHTSLQSQVVTVGLAFLALVTILSGGFVAGLDAGRVFNTFPLMEGRLIPPGYSAIEGWRNAFENPIAAQLHHRALALLTACAVWSAWAFSERRGMQAAVRRWMRLAALAALAQVVLGIATLLLAVPVYLGVAHQIGAVILFTTLLLGATAALDMPLSVTDDVSLRPVAS